MNVERGFEDGLVKVIREFVFENMLTLSSELVSEVAMIAKWKFEIRNFAVKIEI